MDAKQLIIALRKHGLSQTAIAEKCGLSQGAISHIEIGRRKNVLLSTQQQLERLYAETCLAEGVADNSETPGEVVA
ncbi:hypothetical protein WS62_23395 [Burkholderia sp. ABCPW 14]|uniref:helix-turn-helix domain-containing protein n=1 Tax=Burkholderia sp. ABCPW 14 TaxID=1637860 RepID=UPI000770E3ED|nr:helix-turn-helix transcriptional regulator [Burkholderia sp. ABCPW 14]KVD81904.1 hypothetical protein WS62_23395 [Burkholderia sp. ABCPW 14]